MSDLKIEDLVKTVVLVEDLEHIYQRDEAAALYIKYTGACLKGVQAFIEKYSATDTFSIIDMLEITKNAQYSTAFVDAMRENAIGVAEKYGGGVLSEIFDSINYTDTYTLDKDNHQVSFNRPNDDILITQENDEGTIKNCVAKNIDVEVKTNTDLNINILKVTERVLIYSSTSKEISNGYNNPIEANVIKIDSRTSGKINLDIYAKSKYIVTVATIGNCNLHLRSKKPIYFNAYGLCDYGNKNLKVDLIDGTAINPTGKTSALAIDSHVKIDKVNGVTVDVANNVNGTISISY